MSFRRYPAYQSCGIEWITKLPEHWRVQPFVSVVREREEPNAGMVENNLLSLSYGKIVRKDISSNDGLLPESFETYQVIHPDDVVLRMTDLQNDKRSLRSAIVEERGIITSAYVAVIPTGIDPRYLAYLLRAYDLMKVFYSMGGGLRQSMKFSDLKRMPAVVPPRSEQRTIVQFLDRETAKIDGLIEEQERLIELLREKRQAVISRAVTKGLSRTAKGKSSGVDWMGDIPVHWDLVPMSAVARIVRGASPRPAGDPKYFNGDHVPWITVAEITKDNYMYLDDTESRLTQAGAGHSNYFPEGTLVYSNSGATLGVPKILRIGGCANDGVVAFLDLSDRVVPEFLYYYLDSITLHIREKIRQGSGQPNLNTDIVKGLRIGLPSREEQQCIIREIETIVEAHSGLTKQAGQAVDLLRERRSALISAAVTGQIDVRGLAEQKAA